MTRLATLGIIGVALLLVFWTIAGILMYQLIYDGHIYQGVRAMGANLSAYRPDDARAELLYRYDSYARKPLTLRAGTQTWQATPAQLGLRFDADRSVQKAYQIGRTGNIFERLFTQWRASSRGYIVLDVALEVDDAVLQGYLKSLEPFIERGMREASIQIQADQSVKITPAVPGVQLQIENTASLIRPTLLSLADNATDLIIQEASPNIKEADLESTKSLVEQMVGSPLTLQFSDKTWPISRQTLAASITQTQVVRDGKPSLDISLDKARLEKLLAEIAVEVDDKPMDARFDFSSGALKVLRESRDGRKLDIAKALEAIQTQARSPIRTVTLPVTSVRPRFASSDGEQLLPISFIDSARTEYFAGSNERIYNIELAAKRLHGVVVLPGDTFSFNREVGPTTLEAGFKWGWAIASSGDKFATVPSEAGGICQVATTLFQLVFWMGYPIEERTPHIYWITRYGQPPKGMKGLDATVDQIYSGRGVLEAAVDVKFTNNTDKPLLIQSHADGKNYLTFALYGTPPPWRVEVSQPKIDEVVTPNPTPVTEVDPNAPPGQKMQIESAYEGFRASITRKVIQAGQEPRILNLVSVYKPARNVFLVGPQVTVLPVPSAAAAPTTVPKLPTAGPVAPVLVPTPVPTARPPVAPTVRPPAAPTATPRR
jgi:vancomycin resistance protein YoaR